uniref:Uncharacterized protein n=1 Tax=Arundo donax TaxID=35708 RepID=A0A0A9E1I5_ARUDO
MVMAPQLGWRTVREVEHVAAEAGGDARPRRGGQEHLAQLRFRPSCRHLMVPTEVAPIEVVSRSLRHGALLLHGADHACTCRCRLMIPPIF